MIPNIDLWCCAALMIKRYDDTAESKLRHVLTSMRQKASAMGSAYGSGSKAIDELQRAQAGEIKH